ncbi:MAG: hypothetical protein ACOYIG_07475 [Acetivibrionales bacterium]|jgi:hypothetical protein
MLLEIREKVEAIWEFLNTPGKELINIPTDSFLARFWRFLTAPREELFGWFSWQAVLEFLEVSCLIVAIVVLILYMIGARGRVARCLYWSISLYVVLQILC